MTTPNYKLYDLCVCPGGEGPTPKRRGRKTKAEKMLLLQQQDPQGSGSDMYSCIMWLWFICLSYLLLSPVEASSAGFSLSDSCFLSSGLESPFILLSRASVTHTHTRQEQTHTQTHTLSACINNPNKQPSSCPDTHSSSSPFTSPTLKSPGGVRRGMTCDTLMPISGPGGD